MRFLLYYQYNIFGSTKTFFFNAFYLYVKMEENPFIAKSKMLRMHNFFLHSFLLILFFIVLYNGMNKMKD
jgi:hypothetical protein